jgi:hypothetical protein
MHIILGMYYSGAISLQAEHYMHSAARSLFPLEPCSIGHGKDEPVTVALRRMFEGMACTCRLRSGTYTASGSFRRDVHLLHTRRILVMIEPVADIVKMV